MPEEIGAHVAIRRELDSGDSATVGNGTIGLRLNHPRNDRLKWQETIEVRRHDNQAQTHDHGDDEPSRGVGLACADDFEEFALGLVICRDRPGISRHQHVDWFFFPIEQHASRSRDFLAGSKTWGLSGQPF